MALKFISIPPETKKPPHGLIVILHGWGANAEDLMSLAPMLHLPEYQFIFPQAPFPHPQSPLGRAWYALETPEYKGLTETQNQVREWLESLEASTGVPLSKTILGGFSQGGAMALDVGRYFPLAGLISLSGYLHFSPEPLHHPLSPVLIVHGKQDPVVPVEAAQQARNVFQQLGAQVEYQEFNMGHEIRPEVLGLIRSFVMNSMSQSTECP